MIVSVFIVTFELCIVLEITRFALSDRHAIQDIVVIYCDAAGGEAFEVMGNGQQKDFFLCLLLCCGGSRLYVQGLSEEPRRIEGEAEPNDRGGGKILRGTSRRNWLYVQGDFCTVILPSLRRSQGRTKVMPSQSERSYE